MFTIFKFFAFLNFLIFFFFLHFKKHEERERSKAIRNSCYKRMNGMMLVFDLTEKQTFERLSNWTEEIRLNKSEKAKIILVGTKCDLKDKRAITNEEINKFAIENSLEYFETSSKLKLNVDHAFEYLIQEVMGEIYPVLKNFLHSPSCWTPEIHSKFPSKFKETIFCFLLSLKQLEREFKFKVPKVIRFEIFQSVANFEEILKDIAEVPFFPEVLKPPTTTEYCTIF